MASHSSEVNFTENYTLLYLFYLLITGKHITCSILNRCPYQQTVCKIFTCVYILTTSSSYRYKLNYIRIVYKCTNVNRSAISHLHIHMYTVSQTSWHSSLTHNSGKCSSILKFFDCWTLDSVTDMHQDTCYISNRTLSMSLHYLAKLLLRTRSTFSKSLVFG